MYTDKKIRVRLVGKLHSLVECRIAVIRPGVIHADVLIAVVKNLFQLQHDRQVNVLLIDSLLVRTDGSSSVPQNFVKMINEHGGKMPDAVGIPEEQLRQAARSSVCKINIDSDLRLAMTASIREHFALHPADFDPRQYLKPARQAIKELVAHKIVDVLGCDGKAF